MNISTIILILIGVFGVALFILFVGGLLARSDAHRATLLSAGAIYPRPRLLEDFRPVQDLVADFVAKSDPSRQLLAFLGEHAQPASIIELRANLPLGPERLWTAVLITSVAGLIRFARNGMTLTDAGHAVRAQLTDAPVGETEAVAPVELERPASLDSAAPVAAPSELDTGRRSHLELVRDGVHGSETGAVPDRIRARPRFEIGRLRKPATVADESLEHGAAPATSDATPRAQISAADHQELSDAIVAARKLAVTAVETRPLQGKLMNAMISRAGDIPHDLITMNSRAEVVDLETGERVDLALVYPADANIAKGRISVFHPLGAAMLGHRVGDEFEWPVPYGTRRFKVAAIQFQPEAAFAMAA